MAKGQISFDFMLAVVAALIFIGSLNVVSGQVTAMQSSASIRQQLHSIGLNLAAVLSSSAALDDAGAGYANISYTIPKIAVLGETKLQGCDIEIEGSSLKLSYELFDVKTGASETIQALVPFAEPGGMQLIPELTSSSKGTCGGTIRIISEG